MERTAAAVIIIGSILFLIAAKDMPPFVYYIITLIAGMVMLR